MSMTAEDIKAAKMSKEVEQANEAAFKKVRREPNAKGQKAADGPHPTLMNQCHPSLR